MPESWPSIALFALTGFGNPVLRALTQHGMRPSLVMTRRESGPHPYYPEQDLAEEARALHVPVRFAEETSDWLDIEPVDLILVATFHRLLPAAVRARASWGINLHPSLLPAYRGASPCFWVLRNGERTTGLTGHVLSGRPDAGPVVWQQHLAIDPLETQGSLRQRLAALAAKAAVEVVEAIALGGLAPVAQRESGVSAFPPFRETDRFLDLTVGPEALARHFRALQSWPGALLEHAGQTWQVRSLHAPARAPRVVACGELRLELGETTGVASLAMSAGGQA